MNLPPLPVLRQLGLIVAILCGSAAIFVSWAQEAPTDEAYGRPGRFFVRPREASPPPDPLAALSAEARRVAEAPWEDGWQTDRARMVEFGIAGSRAGAVLTLALDGDLVVHFVDNLEDCDVDDGCLVHAFDGAFGDRYLVVTALAYESSWSYLIDRRGGVVHKIVAIPVLSADEDFAVAASVSLVDMAVEVIAFEASGPVLEHVEIDESCSLEPSWPADMALEWEPVRLGPDVIELRSESEPDPGALLTRLERRDARWRAVCSRK